MIRIHFGRTFIQIPCTHKTKLGGPVKLPALNDTNFRMNFHVGQPNIHPNPFIFQPPLPHQIGFLIEPCFQFNHHRYLFPIAHCVDQCIDYPGILGQSIQCNANTHHRRINGRFSKQINHTIK